MELHLKAFSCAPVCDHQQVGQHPPLEQALPELLGVVDKPMRQLNVLIVLSISVEPHLLHLSSALSDVTPTNRSNSFLHLLQRYE